jgi:hypothetical protein
MRTLAIASLLLGSLPIGSMANKSKVSRGAIQAIEENMDSHLRKMWPDDPMQVIGLTQGAYINGFGAVFMSEVNLSPGAGITPFHQTITKDELTRMHDKKLTRLPKLKEAMQDMLLNSASSLDSVPANEQITLGITLFYWHGENTEGLPAQIVMHAQRRALVNAKTGMADKSTLATAVTVDQF